MDFRQKIGKRIKEAREQAGIRSVTDLAERCGVERPLLYMYEAGNRLPKPAVVTAIAKATGVDPAWIMGLSDRKTELEKQYLVPSGLDEVAFKQGVLGTKDTYLLKMTGNIMEPTFRTGDWILIDTQDKNLSEGVFAIKLGEEIIIRRIQRTLEGGCMVIADNKEYPPQQLTDKAASKLDIVGKVILFSRKV